MEAIFENARIKCQPGAPRWASLVNKLGEEELLILCPFYISTYTVLYFHFTILTFSCFFPFLFLSYVPLFFPLIFYPSLQLSYSFPLSFPLFLYPFLSSLSIFHFCYYNVFFFFLHEILLLPTFQILFLFLVNTFWLFFLVK